MLTLHYPEDHYPEECICIRVLIVRELHVVSLEIYLKSLTLIDKARVIC